MDESPEARLFLFLAKNILEAKKVDLAGFLRGNAIGWKRFKDIAAFHELWPFFYPEMKNAAAIIPADLLEVFKQSHYQTLLQTQRMWHRFLVLAETFQKKDLSMVPLKGMASLADIYRDMPFRAMADTDILVREQEMDRVREVLAGEGYASALGGLKEEYWLKKHCELTFYRKGEEPLDVHFGLDFKRSRGGILPRLWERVQSVSIDGRQISLLSLEDQLFSLALHERRYGGKMFCLKNVFDLAMILKKYGSGFDWDYVLREADVGKMRATVFFILLQAATFFDAAVPDLVWKRLKVPELRRRAVAKLIKEHTFDLAAAGDGKELFLKSHFLLFDGFWEPISYILNIPIEQFAKYYGLEPYARRTEILYRMRFFYLPYCHACGVKPSRYYAAGK